MDTHYFNKSIIIEMLILAVCSFLKVNDMVNTDTKLLQKFRYLIIFKGITFQKNIKNIS
jgi:hypothetical protein